MAYAIARDKSVKIAPRKVRLVADLIRGKKVAEARDILLFTLKVAAPVLRKVLESAVANAENGAAESNERIDTDEMVVTHLLVNEGRTLSRFQPAPRGRAHRIRKRSSQIELAIEDK
jgi:large subunit ribosomal protein L22